jgi:glutathione synthase/RimK-type ligase-like ATP-grasp enzyme
VLPSRSILVYHEHPDWFRPLFAALERRGIAHQRVDASRHSFDPSWSERASATDAHDGAIPASGSSGARPRADGPLPLVFNRMSPSAWKRGRADAILYTLHYLRWLETIGAPVVNGVDAFTVETSKALQITLIERLGLNAPRTRVVDHPTLLPTAARGLAFPLVVKPNIGGSGAGIVRFDAMDDLEAAVAQALIPPSVDGILLLQEFHPPADGSIVRVETLEGRYLYGIRVHIAADAGYDLCPADICRDVAGTVLESAACPAGAAKSGLTVEGYVPPPEIRHEVERIAQASRLDVGGIEYLVSARDGRRYYYDVNALSNFVADPVRVVGFDPTERLVDALVARARIDSPESRAWREPRAARVPRTDPAGERRGRRVSARAVASTPVAEPEADAHDAHSSVRAFALPIEEIAPTGLSASASIVAPVNAAPRSAP